MKSNDFLRLIPPTGLELTLTFDGDGAGTALMFREGLIVLKLTTGLGTTKKVTLTTPTSFRVLDVWSVHSNGTGAEWTLRNGDNAISTEVAMVNITDIDRVVDIDNDKYEFVDGDDDLVVINSASGIALFELYIKIQYI